MAIKECGEVMHDGEPATCSLAQFREVRNCINKISQRHALNMIDAVIIKEHTRQLS